jgi:hypothetical protein
MEPTAVQRAGSIYTKLVNAMKAVEGQHPTIAGMNITSHQGQFLASLTAGELAHLQASMAWAAMTNADKR